MTENMNTISEAERAALDNNFDHAMRIMLDAQSAVNGVVPPSVVASASCAAYLIYVAGLCAANDIPKESVAVISKEAIDTMGDFISATYDRMVKEIEKATK